MPTLSFLHRPIDLSSPAQVSACDEVSLWSAMFGLMLLEELPLGGADVVLDVGCGTGFPLIELAERLGPSCTVHGIDPWQVALERARQKIAARGTPNVVVHEGDAAAMPFADGTFALIVSNLGVNNFEDREGALRECRRVARADGRIALTTNLQGHMREFYGVFWRVLNELGESARLEAFADHVNHRTTVSAVLELLERTGFSVVRVVEREGVMRFRDGDALLNHHFIRMGFLDAWKTVAGERQIDVFTRLLDELNELARRSGELRLSIPMAYVEAVAA